MIPWRYRQQLSACTESCKTLITNVENIINNITYIQNNITNIENNVTNIENTTITNVSNGSDVFAFVGPENDVTLFCKLKSQHINLSLDDGDNWFKSSYVLWCTNDELTDSIDIYLNLYVYECRLTVITGFYFMKSCNGGKYDNIDITNWNAMPADIIQKIDTTVCKLPTYKNISYKVINCYFDEFNVRYTTLVLMTDVIHNNNNYKHVLLAIPSKNNNLDFYQNPGTIPGVNTGDLTFTYGVAYLSPHKDGDYARIQ